MEGLGVIDVHIADVHPEEVYKLARTLLLNNKEADGIFISCTDLRSAEILDVLESDVGKPRSFKQSGDNMGNASNHWAKGSHRRVWIASAGLFVKTIYVSRPWRLVRNAVF